MFYLKSSVSNSHALLKAGQMTAKLPSQKSSLPGEFLISGANEI